MMMMSIKSLSPVFASHDRSGDFGLSVSIRRRLEGSHSWDGTSSATPMTGSDSSLFFGHLGTVGGIDLTGELLNKDANNNLLNSSGDDLASLCSSGLSRKKHDVSLDSLSRDTSTVSASHAEVSVVAGTAAYAPPLSTGSFADDLYAMLRFLQRIFVTFRIGTVSVLCSLSCCTCSRRRCTGRRVCVKFATRAVSLQHFVTCIRVRAL